MSGVSGRRRWLALTAAAVLLAAPLAFAGEHDCTYDQDDQVRVVREVAKRHPGGRVDEKDRRVTWTLPGGGSIVFEYGGCTHLGSIVTRAERTPAALSRERVFAIATDLAAKYWKKEEAEDLRTGLAKREFQTETVDGRTYYHVRHEDLSQFYVEYAFLNGTSRVAIAWSRTF